MEVGPSAAGIVTLEVPARGAIPGTVLTGRNSFAGLGAPFADFLVPADVPLTAHRLRAYRFTN
jgi:hypothetical protein